MREEKRRREDEEDGEDEEMKMEMDEVERDKKRGGKHLKERNNKYVTFVNAITIIKLF